MAELTSKSIDEITGLIVDTYDELVKPKRVFRSVNNKLFLQFRGIAAGYGVIQDAALSLHSKFDPEQCSDDDLYSTAKMVGTDFKQGKGSFLEIAVVNSDVGSKTLFAGTYVYTSVDGIEFTFTLGVDSVFDPAEEKIVTAVSTQKGAFKVSTLSSIAISRADFAAIDPAFLFSCSDNSSSLGYADETAWDFRVRINTDTTRQDQLKELELAIRNMPNILECNLMLNQSPDPATYDGVDLDPYQLLVVITGVATDEIASMIANAVLYTTKMVDPGKVVYHYSDNYVDGKYPVFYKNHEFKDYDVVLDYRYDSSMVIAVNVEAEITAALAKYKNASTRVDVLTEDMIYNDVTALNIVSVRLLNVTLKVGGVEVGYIDFPKTRLPNMATLTFNATDVLV